MKTPAFTLACGAGLLAAAFTANAGLFIIGGVEFDSDNSAQTGAIVEGLIHIEDHSSRVFARIEAEPKVLTGDRVNPFIIFDRGKSIGRLLGRESRKADDRARYVSFPEKGVPGPQPNKDRVTIELTWGKFGIRNDKGPDFAVFEVGSYEAFAVAVRKAGSLDFTFYRYQFAHQSDPVHGVNSVVFDLSSFGVAEGEIIDAIRIRNVFNSEAKGGNADKVDNAIGEGRVIYPTDPDYAIGHKLLSSPRGSEFRTESLDADLIYAVSLQKLVLLGQPAPAAPAAPPAN